MSTVLGKRALVFVGWAVLGGLCAVAFGLVTGLVRPDEKINALWLVVAAACFYVLAYRFYGRFLARPVVELDNRRITPAHRLNDGANFHPTNRWVLFGHHFAAIAGAGPLLGPVLAVQFGFLPGFLWLVVGAVLAGAVQDFVILVASMRRNGRSLPQIDATRMTRSEEHTSELQSQSNLVCRLLLEKKKKKNHKLAKAIE